MPALLAALEELQPSALLPATLQTRLDQAYQRACLAPDAYEAFLLAIMSAGFKLPHRTRNILITVSF